MRHADRRLTMTAGALMFGLATVGLWGGPGAVGAAGGESAFVGLPPCRLVDTRGNGFGGPFGPPALATGVPRDFPLQGQCGIPVTATAVSLNVTATSTQGPGFLLLFPQGGVLPLVSTLNYVAGETVANAALVPLGAGGLTVVAGVSGTDLILDVDGYFTDSLVHAVATDNLFLGVGTLPTNVAGSSNIAAGAGALANITTGTGNTAIGVGTLGNSATGSNNTAVGLNALPDDTTGEGNTAIAGGALTRNTTGNFNVAIGLNALVNNTTGSGNIAIGVGAGSSLTTGANNIHIGHVGNPAEDATLRLGSAQNRTFIVGIRAVTTANANAVPVLIDSAGQLGTVNSSRRVKTDIEDIGTRSRALHALRPVSFRYRVHPPDGPVEYGLIAEEVAEVYPELVIRDAGGAPETVRYHLLPALLLNELQRQERVLAEKDRRLTELEATVAELAAEVARLKGRGLATAERLGEEP